ncbi:unnamed protein product, partial [Ectocarpus sp. 12 AP-2014]
GGSYGLEGNGKVFSGSGVGQTFGDPFCTGDTVGLGVNFRKMEVREKTTTTSGKRAPCARFCHFVFACLGRHSGG